MIRSALEEEVARVAFDGGERSIREVVPLAGAPEVYAIVTCHIKVSDCVFEAVVVVFGGC